jgi:uncharacterized protein
MNESVQEVLCQWIDNKLRKKEYEVLSITWFGGEPLMFPDIIKRLSKSFINSCDKYSVKYNASMITNGYLIEKVGSSCFLNECNISTLQITIDGTKETHNQRRILLNNPLGTYDTIISGINSLANSSCQIKVRVNLDKINNQVIEETCSQLADNIKNKENVYPYIAKMYCMDDLNAGIEDRVLNTEEYVLSAIIFSELAEKAGFKVKKKSIIPKAKMWYCPAPYGKSLVIDPDGDLYYCWNDIGIKEYRTGSIINNDNNNFYTQRELWHNHAFDFHNDCKVCKAFVLCAGGCVREKIRSNKDYTCVDFAKCSYMTIKHYLKT